MKRAFVWMSLSLCLGAMAPHPSHAQIIRGGTIPVHDHHDWLRHLVASLQALLQAGDSDQRVEVMVTTLIRALYQVQYPLGDFEAELAGMSEAAGPRPMTARNLDYLHENLQAQMKILYPGYSAFGTPVYPDAY